MDRALPFIRSAVKSGNPFLAVIWFHAPHLPVVAGPEYTKLYPDATPYERHYYGCITALDEQMGRLRQELRTLQIADNTMLWFCSDNGAIPEGSAGGFRGKKGQVYEGGVRVPGLVEWPARFPKPAATDVPCVTSDIYPTVLDILGIRGPNAVEPLDGVSLLPLFEGRMKERSKPIGFWHYAPKKDVEFSKDGGQAAWTGDRWKLVRPGPRRVELYDLLADPAESKDVAAAHPEVVAALTAELDAWQESVLKSYRGEDYSR